MQKWPGRAHSITTCTGGSDADRFRGCILPLDALVFAEPPPRRPVGRSRRDAYRQPRKRKLMPEQQERILAGAGSRSLRELAAEFGVSHEAIRAVRREWDTAVVW